VNLTLPDKAVETGIQDVYDRLSAGKLKVFASCSAWSEEFWLYRRDDRGRVVKKHDRLMDCTRYLVRSGLQRMKAEPQPGEAEDAMSLRRSGALSWMG
jgi:hypothetical protein